MRRGKRRSFAHRKGLSRIEGVAPAASPMKISSESISAMMKKLDRPSQGADRFRTCLPLQQQFAERGRARGAYRGRGNPAKSAMLIEEFTMKGRKVRVATIALGNTCLTMIFAFERPSARAALTYSKLRARRNSARTRWTRLTHENRSRMNRRRKKLGAGGIARENDQDVEMPLYGSDDQISMNLCMTRSSQPPK